MKSLTYWRPAWTRWSPPRRRPGAVRTGWSSAPTWSSGAPPHAAPVPRRPRGQRPPRQCADPPPVRRLSLHRGGAGGHVPGDRDLRRPGGQRRGHRRPAVRRDPGPGGYGGNDRRCWRIRITLHRAFDVCRDPFEALETALELGWIPSSPPVRPPTPGRAGRPSESCSGGWGTGETSSSAAGSAPGPSGSCGRCILPPGASTSPGRRSWDSGMIYRNPAVSMGLPGISEVPGLAHRRGGHPLRGPGPPGEDRHGGV